jgi:hypothetical protein
MNNKKNNILYTIIIFILIIIFIFIIVLLYSKFGGNNLINTEKKIYDITPIKGDVSNMNICPKGCVRGRCDISKKNNSCKYDFQCNMCQDNQTKMFYLNYDKKNIIPIYEESSKLNYNQIKLLDKEINRDNIYIKNLNNTIIKLNS